MFFLQRASRSDSKNGSPEHTFNNRMPPSCAHTMRSSSRCSARGSMGMDWERLPPSTAVTPNELSDASVSEPPHPFTADGSMAHSDGTSRCACLADEICIDEYMRCGMALLQKSFLANIFSYLLFLPPRSSIDETQGGNSSRSIQITWLPQARSVVVPVSSVLYV